MEEHRKHGDFVRVGPNHISINNPQAVAEIYGHKSGFLKSEFYDAFLQVRPVLFNIHDSKIHQRKRKYMNPAFSARALTDFEPIMDSELLKWKNQVLKMVSGVDSAKVDFAVWSTLKCFFKDHLGLTGLTYYFSANFLAFDVIGSFAFGKPFGFIEKGHDPYNLIQTIDTRGEVLNALGNLPLWIRPYMKYNRFDPFWSDGLRATANLEHIGRNAFAERKSTEESRKDFFSHLLTTDEPIPEEEMVAEAISFIVGGSDTTSSTMTNFIDIISRDKDLQKRLVKEIEQVYPGDVGPDWVPTNQVISNMPFLNNLLREVMRVRPTSATGLERVTPPQGRNIAGKYIPGGASLHLRILA